MRSRGLSTAAAAVKAGAGAGAPRAGGGRMAAWRAHAHCSGDARAAAAALRLEDARRPARRAHSDVLVRVAAASINPIDLAVVGGYGARVLDALRGLTGGGVGFPLVPGRDFAGVVAGAAPGARLAPGARVWGVVPPHLPGSHAQYVVVDRDWVGSAPDALSDLEAGGALYAGLTACAALRAAGLRPGCGGGAGGGARRVLLLGLGGVGQAALQLLARAGHRVLAACSPDQHALAAALGAEPRDRHREDCHERLRQDGPFDAVLDCAGLGGAGAAGLRAGFGVYVTLSSPLLRRADALGLAPGLAAAAADLLRANLAAPPAPRAPAGPAPPALAACAPRVRWAFFSPRADDIELLRRLADQGEFTVSVERAWSWRDGAAAYARAADGHARGKLLLDFSQP